MICNVQPAAWVILLSFLTLRLPHPSYVRQSVPTSSPDLAFPLASYPLCMLTTSGQMSLRGPALILFVCFPFY